MKAIEQYFSVARFVLLYSVGLTFESVDETLKCARPFKSVKPIEPILASLDWIK